MVTLEQVHFTSHLQENENHRCALRATWKKKRYFASTQGDKSVLYEPQIGSGEFGSGELGSGEFGSGDFGSGDIGSGEIDQFLTGVEIDQLENSWGNLV